MRTASVGFSSVASLAQISRGHGATHLRFNSSLPWWWHVEAWHGEEFVRRLLVERYVVSVSRGEQADRTFDIYLRHLAQEIKLQCNAK